MQRHSTITTSHYASSQFVPGPTLDGLTREEYLLMCEITGCSPLPWACPPGIVIDLVSCRPRKRMMMDDFEISEEKKSQIVAARLKAKRELERYGHEQSSEDEESSEDGEAEDEDEEMKDVEEVDVFDADFEAAFAAEEAESTATVAGDTNQGEQFDSDMESVESVEE